MFSVVVRGTRDRPASSGPGKYGLTSGSGQSKGALTFANFVSSMLRLDPEAFRTKSHCSFQVFVRTWF